MSRRKSRGLGEAASSILTPSKRLAETRSEGDAHRPSIVSTLQQGYTEGDGQARELPLDHVAPHPQNRPADELEGLANSIQSVGVLQPIVVVPVEIFLSHWSGAAGDVPAAAEWVVYAGHRRHAASMQAGKTSIPAIIRDDLNEPAAAPTTRLVENIHRKDLTPLEAARDFALLADLGHGQSDIAKMCGVSQPHVSKRIRLLRLPQQVQDAVAVGEVTLGEADKLTQLETADEQIHVLERFRRTGSPITTLITDVEAARRERERIAAARTQAEAENVEIVDASRRFGAAAKEHRLTDEAEVEAARGAGTLVAEPTPYGLWYYTTEKQKRHRGDKADSGTGRAKAGPAAQEPKPDAHADAEAPRLRACADLVRKSRPKRKTAPVDSLIAVLLRQAHRVNLDEARGLAHEWLAETIGESSGDGDVDAWLASLDELETAWAAYAICVAVGELITQGDPDGDIARMHVGRLASDAGYEPTPDEANQIMDSAEYSGGISEGKRA